MAAPLQLRLARGVTQPLLSACGPACDPPRPRPSPRPQTGRATVPGAAGPAAAAAGCGRERPVTLLAAADGRPVPGAQRAAPFAALHVPVALPAGEVRPTPLDVVWEAQRMLWLVRNVSSSVCCDPELEGYGKISMRDR